LLRAIARQRYVLVRPVGQLFQVLNHRSGAPVMPVASNRLWAIGDRGRGGRSRPNPQTSPSSPLLTSRTSSFHSACDSRTVFASPPIVTPWSVISTSGHAVQAGHSVIFIGSRLQSSLIWTPAHLTVCSRYRRKSYF